MQLSIPALALLIVATFGTMAAAQDDLVKYGICTCFKPKYDASCCLLVKGGQFGNVCDTPDFGDSVQKYKNCCYGSGGTIKCKVGYRDPSHVWPPEDTYNCSS
ncbi:hypothetical protein BGW38_000035 [Lunasporangiospora selenospora]|uniref:Uncharacterized protein n=1 Tax=Lunasporangiospora selenospora TaxID=979761 RepID=A0A9P6G2I6_9FUNG|nr:hypothetical protein BGW38_000035 [Lunasporangiospora selenospora]